MRHLLARPSPARLAAIGAVVLVGAVACGAPTAAPPATTGSSGVGAKAPLDFQAPTVSGNTLSGETLAGKPAVLWFWAPWCTICRAEGPAVAGIAERHADEVTFVGVAGRGELPQMKDFVADTGTGAFPHVVDADGSLWSSFGVISQPAFAFIQPDGSMDVIVGSLPGRDLAGRVAALAGRGGRPAPR